MNGHDLSVTTEDKKIFLKEAMAPSRSKKHIEEEVAMARKEDTNVLDVLDPVCCGLDVHKKSISACLITQTDSGEHVEQRHFGTSTHNLRALKDWLLENECPVVAIESTGVYWRPVFNVLESSVQVTLVNARHTQHVPGRKTDMSDAKWVAGLLRHGLVRASFIPPEEIRRWRDRCRQRKSHVDSLGDYKRRVHGVLLYVETLGLHPVVRMDKLREVLPNQLLLRESGNP